MNVRLAHLNPGYLYHLSYGSSDTIFYIGLTGNPRGRYQNHVSNYGKSTIMTVFSELVNGSCDSIEAYVILNAVKNGFKLKNNLNGLSNTIVHEHSFMSCDLFMQSIEYFNDLIMYDGIKILPNIDKKSVEKLKPKVVRIQIVLTETESNLLSVQAGIQGRSISNLGRIYLLECINRVEQLKIKI